jgi:hypothetical protein
MRSAMRGAAFLHRRDMAYVKSPPDRRIFLQGVYTVNAYAFPPWNEVVFLAAIVRPPFFDPKADPAVNYGAIGAVIGHEGSHLFDDQGRKVDGDGLLNDWWTPADAKSFVAAAEKLSEQVGSYEALPGHSNALLFAPTSPVSDGVVSNLHGLVVAVAEIFEFVFASACAHVYEVIEVSQKTRHSFFHFQIPLHECYEALKFISLNPTDSCSQSLLAAHFPCAVSPGDQCFSLVFPKGFVATLVPCAAAARL